jgi:transposase
MESSKTTNKFSPEVRERAVRMVREHQGEYASQWAAISSGGDFFDCGKDRLHGADLEQLGSAGRA